ncbi:chaplin [Streptomyces sp. ICBB 8177]|uniref:chaplin n=1 Tax=Streptomyces sp. ICBB 8177 TaxID=563922 RepID=UPI000D678F70|nr:chaplin [Streptomyces sp. ICBB 8177]PWI41314.1 hypothetical protein CK485_20590 [Streptomyces sp. ICBB 8177]
MKQVARKGLVTALAAGGVLAAAGGYAYADSGAASAATGSPGVLSGNLVQLPVDVPVNVCGNTVNVVGLLNPTTGNACANTSHGGGHARPQHSGGTATQHAGGTHGGSVNGGGAGARGAAEGSPGVLSGNGIQLPVDLPVNVSGNSVNVVGVGNPTFGNTSVNHEGHPPTTHPCPPAPHKPAPHKPAAPVHHSTPRAGTPVSEAMLAHTGAQGVSVLVPASATALVGGFLLYRRFRPGRA